MEPRCFNIMFTVTPVSSLSQMNAAIMQMCACMCVYVAYLMTLSVLGRIWKNHLWCTGGTNPAFGKPEESYEKLQLVWPVFKLSTSQMKV
jgi:hypothetical protein